MLVGDINELRVYFAQENITLRWFYLPHRRDALLLALNEFVKLEGGDLIIALHRL